MTIAEYIVNTLAEYDQTGNDLLWIWHTKDGLVSLTDKMFQESIRKGDHRNGLKDIEIFVFTKDYVFIKACYDDYEYFQPVPNNMMIASKMTEYPCYGG